jgi:phage-related minor tail protein
MSDQQRILEMAYAQHVSEHYRRASEELLHAYQRNKEANRHHDAGAFKAALHHVKLSKHHAFNAHEHLKEALLISEKIGEVDVPLSISIGMNDKPGLQ